MYKALATLSSNQCIIKKTLQTNDFSFESIKFDEFTLKRLDTKIG